jgi:hypothetical protein
MRNHTPGPWKIEERSACRAIVPASGAEVTFIYRQGSVTTRERSDEELAANAALIAAAPMLLEAAREVLGALDTLSGDRVLPMICEHGRDALRSAIAAAEGKPCSSSPPATPGLGA